MIHFIYLLIFASLISIAFAVFHNGDTRARVIYGLKLFAQFIVITLAMAWVFYFIPW
ncbi:MAG: hypothetical protein ACK5NT_14110 [Pyrinomonadaceae bacterium]